jgi:predicted XRE-type DNA-binding protein
MRKKRGPPEGFAMSQRDIAKALDIDRGAVNYIEVKAIANFKKELEKRGYKIEDLITLEDKNERK